MIHPGCHGGRGCEAWGNLALTVDVAAETDDLSICLECTGVEVSRCHGHHGPQVSRNLALASIIAPEALQLTICLHDTGVIPPRCHTRGSAES